VTLQQQACPGQRLLFSTCSQFAGNTYFRLYLDGSQVASNDNVRPGELCSEVSYDYAEADCGTLQLRLGCKNNDACQMTGTVEVTVAFTPTPEPTPEPTAPPICVDPDVNAFPHSTCTLTDTNDAQQNTVSVRIHACPGDLLLFYAAPYVGHPYIRLYLDGVQVGLNNLGLASVHSGTYAYTADCGTLELRLGCSGSSSCQMTAIGIVF